MESNQLHYFLPAAHLGVLEHQMKSLVAGAEVLTKRKREREFKRFSRLLVDLKMVSSDFSITMIGLGVRSDGEPGLVVVAETTKVQGQVAPNACNRVVFENGVEAGKCVLPANHPGEHIA